MGIVKKQFVFKKFKNTNIWKLTPKAYSIPEINVFDNEMVTEEWGFNKERYKQRDGRGAPRFIRALYISNPDKAIGIIEKVHYYISKHNNPTQPFRVRLFKPDKNGKPGSDLLNENLVVQAKEGGKFLTVDLTAYQISIPENGFFIGAETLFNGDPNEFEKYNNESYYIAFGYTYKWHRKNMGWVYKPKRGWIHLCDKPKENVIGCGNVFYATVKIKKQSFFKSLFE